MSDLHHGSRQGRGDAPGGRALGIDFGEKRIGIAISDPGGRLALPLDTLARRSDRSAAAAIAELARREGVVRLVLGEPVGVDGRRGAAALRVRRFGTRLAAVAGLPLTYVGETLTSVEAAARLRQAGVDLRRHPERIDAAAAQILLQEDLDRGAPAKATTVAAPVDAGKGPEGAAAGSVGGGAGPAGTEDELASGGAGPAAAMPVTGAEAEPPVAEATVQAHGGER